jgi:hypothetical protein
MMVADSGQWTQLSLPARTTCLARKGAFQITRVAASGRPGPAGPAGWLPESALRLAAGGRLGSPVGSSSRAECTVTFLPGPPGAASSH